MKKNITSLLILLLVSSLTHAQFTGPRQAQSNLLNQQDIDLSKVKGSPFEQKEFVLGKIIDEITGKEKTCFIRFNVLTDEVEIKDELNDNNITSMLKSKGIYALVNNKEYRQNFFTTSDGRIYNRISICLLNSKPQSIHKYIEKEFIPERKATTSLEKDFPAKLKSTEEYFLENDGIITPVELHKKRLLKALPSHKKTIEKFIKSNKLKIKNEEELIKVIKYYNSL